MEFQRLKNTDTRIVFPIIDADGDTVTGAASLDSEWLSFATADHGGAAPSFADCTHEATEIGTTGIYYLDIQAGEINSDFTYIQVKTSTSGAKTQHLVIKTYVNSNEDIHTDVATAIADIAAVHVHAQTIIDDVAAVHVHAQTIIDDVAAVHVHAGTIETDVAAVHTHINDIHDTDLPAVKVDTAAIKAKTDMFPAVWYSP